VGTLLERNVVYINLFFAIIAGLLLDHFPKYFSFTGYFDIPLLDYLAACSFLFYTWISDKSSTVEIQELFSKQLKINTIS